METDLEVIWTPKALERLGDGYLYLQLHWSQKVADKFDKALKLKVDQLSRLPKSGPASEKKLGLRKILITPHNYLYYRLEGNYLRIIDIIDTRQEPL